MKKSIIFFAITAALSTQAGNHIQFFKDGLAQINLEKKLQKENQTTILLPFSTVLETVDVNSISGEMIDSYSITRSGTENANSFYEMDFDVSKDLNIRYEYQVGDIEWKPKYSIYFDDKGSFDFKYNLEIKNNTSTKYENFTSDFIFYDIAYRHYDSYNEEKKEDLSEISFDNEGNKIIIKKKTTYNENGFDQFGFDKEGYNRNGFDKNGYDKKSAYGNDLVEKIEDINVLNYNKSISLKPHSIKNISYFKDNYLSEKITYDFNYHDSSVIREICHYSNLNKDIHNKMDAGIIRTFKKTNYKNYLINEKEFNEYNNEKEIKICLDQKTMPKTSFSPLKSKILKEKTFETKKFNITISLINNSMTLNDSTIDTKKHALLQNKLSQDYNYLTNEEIVIGQSEDERIITDLYSYEVKNYEEKIKTINSIMNNLSFSEDSEEEIEEDFILLSKYKPVNYYESKKIDIEIIKGKLEFNTVKVHVFRKKQK